MTERNIEQLTSLRKEIVETEQRIASINKKINDLEKDVVFDTVSCGKKGKKPLRTIKIFGYSEKDINRQKIFLKREKEKAEMLREKIRESESEITDYVSTIEDSVVRRIILKRIDGKSWNSISLEVCGSSNESTSRMILRRFLSRDLT